METWDHIVEQSTYGSLFHTSKWLHIIEKNSKYKLIPLLGLKGEKVIALLPLFIKSRNFIKTVFSPPPGTVIPFMGPIIVDYDLLNNSKKSSLLIDFYDKVDEFIFSNLGANYCRIISMPYLLDSRPLIWTGHHVEPNYSYKIDLQKGIELVFQDFKKNLRNKLKIMKNSGIVVEEGHKEDLKFIYYNLLKSYNSQGKKLPITEKYILDLYDTFNPDNLKVFVAKNNGETIGGGIKILYKDSIFSWIGHFKVADDNINDYIHWEVINWGYKNGFKYYYLIGANTKRLEMYKSKYNPELIVYFQARKYSSFIFKNLETFYKTVIKKYSLDIEI